MMEDFPSVFCVVLNIVTLCVVFATWIFIWVDRRASERREAAEAARFRQNYQDAYERSKL